MFNIYSPFIRNNNYHPSITEKCLSNIFKFVFIPIKLLFIIFIIIISSVLCKLATINQYDINNLPEENKSIIRFALKLTARSTLLLCGFYNIDFYEYDTDPEPPILIANHRSWSDILLMIYLFDIKFIAKHDLVDIPIIGVMASSMNNILVDRSKPNQGATKQILDHCKNFSSTPLFIFPEATTTNGEFLIKFKTGAFVPGTSIRPIIIDYPYTKFNPSWDTIPGFDHCIGMLSQFRQDVVIKKLPIYHPSDTEKNDPALYCENVRNYMASFLNVPLIKTDYNNQQYFSNCTEEEREKLINDYTTSQVF